MPVVAVINRKGGSGKSTLATQLAGYCANSGLRVMLGDVDRQQSSLAWLRRRASQPLAGGAAIAGWALGTRSVVRPPAGITHVVLDTPGGLRGFDLARVVMSADMILMPVCDSVFDRESAAECLAELATLPRIASGRCKVAAVGMRLDARTKGSARLAAWAAEHGLPYVGALRETQVYTRSAEQGLTLFDLPAAKVELDLGQWLPILDWVRATWLAAERPDPGARPAAAPRAVATPRAPVLASSTAAGTALAATASVPAPERPSRPAARAHRPERFGWLFAVFRSQT
jgi:chromosome partitioning protein